jgi:hypothetical protein
MSPICYEEKAGGLAMGGFESKLTVTRLGANEFFMVGDSAKTTRVAAWVERHLRDRGHASRVDVTSAWTVLSLGNALWGEGPALGLRDAGYHASDAPCTEAGRRDCGAKLRPTNALGDGARVHAKARQAGGIRRSRRPRSLAHGATRQEAREVRVRRCGHSLGRRTDPGRRATCGLDRSSNQR